MRRDPIDQFREALARRNVAIPIKILGDGKLHRCDADGRNGKGDAAYLLHIDGIPAGGFQNHQDGLGWEAWRADLGRPLAPAELEAHRARVAAMQLEREADEQRRRAEARDRAAAIWKDASPADDTHPYLARKRVKAHGLRLHKGAAVAPLRDADGALHSLQFIDDKAKRYLSGGRVSGCYFGIGKPGDRICIAEGFATGATIHEATGCAVAVAFDAGNLHAVAMAIKAKRPHATLILCADDDYRTAGNPGLAKATEAARAVGGLLAVPVFGPDRPDDASDFNDLARHKGSEAVNRAVANAGAPEVPEGQATVADVTARDLTRETVNLMRADSIDPEPIAWIWKEWLALGKLHILAGTAGTGKTTLALAMIATITTGGRWPDGTRAPIGGVLMWTGEDDPADTLIPRLMAMGADLTRIHFIGGVSGERGIRAFDPASDVRLLSESFADCGDVRLLVVDPIVSAVANDSHKNGEVRRSLQPLVDLAAAHGCALVGITHYSKGTAGRDPLERVTGSLAFGALARVVIGTAKPTEDGEQRRMVRAKSNIGPDGGGFTYGLEQIEVPGRSGLFASRLLWGDPIEGTARDLLDAVESDQDGEKSAIDEAVDFLRELLANGAMPVADVGKAARGHGITDATLRRARGRLKIKPRKAGFTGRWELALPGADPDEKGQGAHEGTQGAHTQRVNAFETSRAPSGKAPIKYRQVPTRKPSIFDARPSPIGMPKAASIERPTVSAEVF